MKGIRFAAVCLAALCVCLTACGEAPPPPERERTFTIKTGKDSGTDTASGNMSGSASGGASSAASGAADSLGAVPDGAVPLSGGSPVGSVLIPQTPGTAAEKNQSASIDYSNAADGYVCARWTEGGDARLKALVKGPSGVSYQYNLATDGTYEVFPLSDGNGDYSVGVYRNISGKEYAAVLSAAFSVQLSDQFAPFLRPNQYVSFGADSAAVSKAAELCEGAEDNLSKVERVYTFVVENTVYDTQKAQSVTSGYLPDVDETLRTGRGICFDYAALMAAMLRSQGVPVKLVVGYTGDVYHAWLSVWSEAEGWIEGEIYFNGSEWKLMDPTFASTGGNTERMRQYIGDAGNYEAKYLY